MIEFCDVSFCYKGDDRASLQHVNLRIKEGEVVVLCGESGCGKSTLIRLINGLIPFYYGGELKGEVRVSGHQTKEGDIYDLGSMVSTVFQNPKSQFFCVEVKSELAFGTENLRIEKDEILRRIAAASQKLNFTHLLDKTMFELSGGEKQKIACASVSVMDNPIVVLDEPSSNLDMDATADLKKMIGYWKKQGKTVVIAEHRLEYLKEPADRFIYMKNGAIVFSSDARRMRTLPEEKLAKMGLRSFSYEHLKIENTKEAEASLGIRDFSFRYKNAKKKSLSIDALDLPKASVVAVIGKNGAGKSTFVRCLCGLEKRGKGVLHDGEKKLLSKNRLDSSFLVMQDVNRQLFSESVEEEITLGMETEDADLLEKILKEFDLYTYRKRHPMSLSGGQKQRVAVASAVASGRDYIIFDEPTSGLDDFHMKQVAGCLKDLQESGKTVLVITHDIELIYACCNYILRIEDGNAAELYRMCGENEARMKKFFNV